MNNCDVYFIYFKTFTKKGFSLIEIMIAIGLLSALSLYISGIVKNSSKAQIATENYSDLSDIKRDVDLILQDSDACKASIATPGFELTFNGASIKTTPKTGLELWTADNLGNRSRKKIFETMKLNKITITSVSFSMPDYVSGTNWPQGTDQVFRGEIAVKGTKSNFSNVNGIKDIIIPVTVTFDTNAAGLSTVKNCNSLTSTSGGDDLLLH